MRIVARTSIVTTIAVLALTACTSPAEPEPSPASTTTSEPAPEPTTDPSASQTSTEPEPTTSPEPEFGGTDPLVGEPAGEADLVLIDVTVTEHVGYDQLVLEFTGTGVPGFTVQYLDQAISDGSGDIIALDGDAILDVVATNTTYPPSQEAYYSGPRQFDPEDGETVDEVYVDGVFEGNTHLMLGIDDGARPFRVLTQTDPARLVVHIQSLLD
ncbi:MAG: hypothetical protein ACK5KU_04635 [Beutenbergiaceae bacterium]